MDSLTQIVLGAAVGEAVLGRRIGNRAMMWGAIGGTIPDLDVLANFFLDPIDALAFHRGITHSLLFSVLMAFPLAWLVWQLYHARVHQKKWYQVFVAGTCTLLLLLIAFGVFTVSGKSTGSLIILLLLSGLAVWRLYAGYVRRTPGVYDTSYFKWYVLFFLALSTHWMLDCFTSFGTQVFFPFSHYRVAFNTVSVVDPIYTIPFILCVILAACMRRDRKWRRILNWTGILWSCTYLLFTVFNKMHVDRVFEKAIATRNLEVTRWRTCPTIFNNILWSCVAEGDSVFYAGLYSEFDTDPNLHYLNVLPKRDHLASPISGTREYQILEWFSEGYLMHTDSDTALILSDVRYGGMRDTIRGPNDLVFNFIAIPQQDGSYRFDETRDRPDDFGEAFRELWERIKGR